MRLTELGLIEAAHSEVSRQGKDLARLGTGVHGRAQQRTLPVLCCSKNIGEHICDDL